MYLNSCNDNSLLVQMHFNWKLSRMLKLCLSIILAAFLQNVQCRPSDTSANATATDHSNLFVGDTTSSNDTRMDSFVSQLGNVEKEIDETLAAISPYLNFMFDTDSDSNYSDDDDDGCVDQMIIQLVPQYITPKEAKEIEDEAEEIKEQSEQASLSKDESSSSSDDELDDLSDSSESSEEFDDDSDDEEEVLPGYDEYYPKYRIYDTRPTAV